MGIFGLSAFVNEHVSLGVQHTWSSDAQQDDHFIIDGNAFTYHYAMKTNFNWIHGGQYNFFADTIRRDIAALQQAGIRLTFLFDGALPQDKADTRMKRYRSYIERAELLIAHLDQINQNLKTQESGIQHAADMYLIPPLMLEVCLQTIRDLGLNPIVCQGEADGHVVRLAHQHQGYVISKDSDMHVYPRIGKGYIPLNTLSIFSSQDNEHHTVRATVYHPQRLATLLQLDVVLLPLFGAILGNDYIDPQLVRYPIMEWCSSRNMPVKNKLSYWPKCVAEYLRDICGKEKNKLPDVATVANHLKNIIIKARENNPNVDGLEQALMTSIYRYDPQNELLNGYVEEEEQAPESISDFGKMSRSIVDCLVTRSFWATLFIEDFQKESSWIISRSLRQCLYTLLLLKDNDVDDDDDNRVVVKEYIREKHHIAAMDVSGLSIQDILKDDGCNDIQHILKDPRQCDKIIYHMHYCDDTHVQAYLTELCEDDRSFVLCLRYLIGESAKQGTPLKNYEVVGLVVGKMMMASSSRCTDDKKFKKQEKKWSEHTHTRPGLKKQVLHLTAQYQSVVFSSYLLSQVLDCNTVKHFKGKLSLENMYDGVNMHQYLQLARRGANIGSLLGGSNAHALGGLFWKIYRATTTSLSDQMEQVYDYSIPLDFNHEKEQGWLEPRNIKKRTHKSSGCNVKKRLATDGIKKKTLENKGSNIFDVLSFGCNFDEDE